MRFDDDKYVDNFMNYGEYPKIHDDIYYLDKYVKGLPVLDIGCCKGLLSVRLAQSHDVVVGIESNSSYFNKAIHHDNVKYYHIKIDLDTLTDVAGVIKEHGIKCVFARRVFPEIYETGGLELVHTLSNVLHENGVEYIVLEGRKPSKNAKNKLYSIEREIAALDNRYDCVKRYKNCALLERS